MVKKWSKIVSEVPFYLVLDHFTRTLPLKRVSKSAKNGGAAQAVLPRNRGATALSVSEYAGLPQKQCVCETIKMVIF